MKDEKPSYGMYTDKGNTAVHQMVTEIKEYAETQCDHCKRFPSEQELREDLIGRMAIVAKLHGEVHDTDVRDHLWNPLKKIWNSLGYDAHDLEAQL